MDSEEKTGTKTISISVPTEMYEWLEKSRINRSRIFQEAVYPMMNPSANRISPIFMLSSIMGICFSVLLMLAAVGFMVYVGIFIASTMFVIGVALLFIVIVMTIRVKNNVSDAVSR